MKSRLTDLPDELFTELLYNLEPKDILNIRATSKSLSQLISQEYDNFFSKYIMNNYPKYYNVIAKYFNKRTYVYILKCLANNVRPCEVLKLDNNCVLTFHLIWITPGKVPHDKLHNIEKNQYRLYSVGHNDEGPWILSGSICFLNHKDLIIPDYYYDFMDEYIKMENGISCDSSDDYDSYDDNNFTETYDDKLLKETDYYIIVTRHNDNMDNIILEITGHN